jgi:hypothetical protein
LLVTYADNVPAFEFNASGGYNGTNIEPAVTNLCLRNRDLPDAAWTKTDATATRTATGIDGVVDSASIVTATGGNATVLQAITSASNGRIFSAFVRRRTGTGTVEITQDNGSTWTAITLTSSFQRFVTARQTLTNPVVGFRVVTSGDEIDVDFCQSEIGGSVPSSPVFTEGSTVTRPSDNISLSGGTNLIGQTEGTIYVEFNHVTATNAEFRTVANLEGNVGNEFNTIRLSTGNNTNSIQVIINVAGVDTLSGGIISSDLTDGIHKIALAYNTATNGVALYLDGTLVGSTRTASSLPAMSRIAIGGRINPFTSFSISRQLGSFVRGFVLYKTRLTNSELASLTTL